MTTMMMARQNWKNPSTEGIDCDRGRGVCDDPSTGILRTHFCPHKDRHATNGDDGNYHSITTTTTTTNNNNNNNENNNNLTVWTGAGLITAECLGTGLLALPHDIRILGPIFGLGFLIGSLPINLYAGTILSHVAGRIEQQQKQQQQSYHSTNNHNMSLGSVEEEIEVAVWGSTIHPEKEGLLDGCVLKSKQIGVGEEGCQGTSYTGLEGTKKNQPDERLVSCEPNDDDHIMHNWESSAHSRRLPADTATFDYVGMAPVLFDSRATTRCITILYYTNIFLVLGNYVGVMAHSVAAMMGDDWICIPTAGVIASTLMFGMSQIRSMAKLGRSSTLISLVALLVVVAQCLYFANHNDESSTGQVAGEDQSRSSPDVTTVESTNLLRKMTAMGSIGFATGSQKLLLNIRHELSDRSKAPQSLGMSLIAFGSFYMYIVLAAGVDPPSFLFDAIPPKTIHRRVAGFLLWVHVVVSYAINSQALCSSIDRLFWYHWQPIHHWSDARRWMVLTGIVALTAFFVANAVPFFKDLVAVIGALTGVPLSLLLPAIYHRRSQRIRIWWPTWESIGSFSLVAYSTVFMLTATIGSIYSILSDWEHHKWIFFSCH